MDTDSIYAKLNISHNEYLKILEENKDLFGKDIGMMESECINNPIEEFISLSSKCYSYICKNDIENNKNKLKNNIVNGKGISNSYSSVVSWDMRKYWITLNKCSVNDAAHTHISSCEQGRGKTILFTKINGTLIDPRTKI